MDAQSIRPIPWAMFAHEVLQTYRPPMRRPTTRAKLKQVLDEFRAYCETTADLDLAAISDWVVDHAGRRPAYVDGLLRALSAACTYGAHPRRRYLWDPFDERPVSSWLPADEFDDDGSDPWPRARTPAEIRAVLARADEEAVIGRWRDLRLRAAVYAFAFTGWLRNEILGLRRADIDLGREALRIRSHSRRRLKTRARGALLPIAPPLAGVLAGYLAELQVRYPETEWAFPHHWGTGPWLSGRPGHRPLDEIRALGERAGVRGLTILGFRHTIATELEASGAPELIIQRILRHARRETQLRYRKPDIDVMRDAVGRVRYGAAG